MGAGRHPWTSRSARTGCAEDRHRSGPCPGVKPGPGPPNPWTKVHGVVRPRADDPLPGDAHLWAGRIGPRTAPCGRPRESARACSSPCTAPRRTASECRSGCGAPHWTCGTGCAVERSPPWPEPQAQDRPVRKCAQGSPRPNARKLRAVEGRYIPRCGYVREWTLRGGGPCAGGCGSGGPSRDGSPRARKCTRRVPPRAGRCGCAGAAGGRASAEGCLRCAGERKLGFFRRGSAIERLSDGGARPDGSERPRVGSAAFLPGSRAGAPCGTGVVL